MALDHIEEWLGNRLKAVYPVEDWMLDSVTSALLLLDDRADAIDTIANFLGTADAPGTNEQIVDELFRRKLQLPSSGDARAPRGEPSRPPESEPRDARVAQSGPTRPIDETVDTRFLDEKTSKKKKDAEKKKATREVSRHANAPPESPEENRRGTSSANAVTSRSVSAHEMMKTVINCLGCGKIFQCASDDGATLPESLRFLKSGCVCTFCHRPVRVRLKDGAVVNDGPRGMMRTSMRDLSASTSGLEVTADDSDALAAEAKNRLVDFDRASAARTVVIDDQSDWFAIESNAWLDEEEREEAKRQAIETERRRDDARRDRSQRITVDLLGRRVESIDASDEGAAAGASAAGRTPTTSGFVLRENDAEDVVSGFVEASVGMEEKDARGERSYAQCEQSVSSPEANEAPRGIPSNPTASFAPEFKSQRGKETSRAKVRVPAIGVRDRRRVQD
jgi:hypothetical protein